MEHFVNVRRAPIVRRKRHLESARFGRHKIGRFVLKIDIRIKRCYYVLCFRVLSIGSVMTLGKV